MTCRLFEHDCGSRTMSSREWIPGDGGRPRGAFLCLHGMESHSRWFEELAVRLAELDWAVVAFDRPGWGQSSGVRGHLESYRDLLAQISSMTEYARGKFGQTHLAGMSWGGMAALYAGLRRGWMFDSLSLVAPGLESARGLPWMEYAKSAWRFARGRLESEIRLDFAPDEFTARPDRREFIRNDGLRVSSVTLSFLVETLKMRSFIRQSAGRRRLPPALCVLAGNDRITDNRAAETVCRRAGIGTETIPDAEHALVFEAPGRLAAMLSRHAENAGAGPGRRRRVWVAGAGAVGGAVGACLALAGHDVSFLARQRQTEIINSRGIVIRSPEGRRRVGANIRAVRSAGELGENPDLVLLSVKSFDTESLLASLAGTVPPGAVIGSLQNGVDNEALIRKCFPKNPIVAAAVCAGLEMEDDGALYWADDRGGVAGAAYSGDRALARDVWLDILPSGGMECAWFDSPDGAGSVKWSKLMLNVAFSALNAVTGLATRDILERDDHGGLAVRALREGFAVMRGLGIDPVDLPGHSVTKLALLVRLPGPVVRRLLARRNPNAVEAAFSMRQDIMLGRPRTEIDSINGAVAREGKALRIPTPANERLCSMVNELQKGSSLRP